MKIIAERIIIIQKKTKKMHSLELKPRAPFVGFVVVNID